VNEWPSNAEIDAMPVDVLSQWFWQPIPAMTAEHQSIVRRAAKRLHQPPAVPPVYRFIDPDELKGQDTRKTTKMDKAKTPPDSAKETQPEQDSLSLFRAP
jgi:hypothetical protein